MEIYRIDTNSRTGIVSLTVPDNYQLQSGDFTSYPAGAYTPITVGKNGQLVGATLEQHQEWVKKWNAEHQNQVLPQPTTTPSESQKANAALMMQMANMQTQQAKINAMLLQEIAMLKTAK